MGRLATPVTGCFPWVRPPAALERPNAITAPQHAKAAHLTPDFQVSTGRLRGVG